jgi:hypothetical protein
MLLVLLWSIDVLPRKHENGVNHAEIVVVDSINFLPLFQHQRPGYWDQANEWYSAKATAFSEYLGEVTLPILYGAFVLGLKGPGGGISEFTLLG